MNGPEHYREAERLLGVAHGDIGLAGQSRTWFISAAQAHATLALTAATIEIAAGPDSTWLADGWAEATS